MNETSTTTPDTSKDVAIRKTDGSLISLMPEDAEGVYKVSKYLAPSDLIPKSFGGRPENVFAAIMYGREIGVSAMQALSNIAVVNGRPSVWGELATALVRQSGLCESLTYKFEGTGATLKCIATGKRKDIAEPHTEEFSMDDAKLAGFDKKDTYVKHPRDMIMWKALHRLYKFLWADVLKGISIREIIQDEIIDIEAEPQVEIKPQAAAVEPTATTPVDEAGKERKGRGSNKLKPEADEIPAETPAEATESEPEPTDRVFGTLIGVVRLNDPVTAATLGFAAKILTKAGEVKYLFRDYEIAIAAKPYVNKTVAIYVKELDKPPVGVSGEIVKFEPPAV